MRRILFVGLIAGLTAAALAFWPSKGPSDAELAKLYAAPLTEPQGPLSVYHLGHSLVNRDMPAMFGQLAGAGHDYESQLGWGTTLKAHWGDEPINGFDKENAHDQFRPAQDAVASGDYDVIVLTEMVEIRDAVAYFDSPHYLALWANAALEARPDVRLYLYETWHTLDDPDGWLERIDTDLTEYWKGEVLRPALADLPEGARIHVIPAGQALAAFVRTVEAQGGLVDVRDRRDLFAKGPDGTPDVIHLNDLGNYLVALVHYAVIYQKDPTGLPFRLRRSDGSLATAPEPETALLMQEIAWEVAKNTPMTGLPH